MQQLCIKIANSETENDVIKLLKSKNLWDNPDCWRDFGENENNFATIGNQQSRPEAAIVEKIINSVDAVLMASVMSQGINPVGNDAPKSIKEALETFFDIPEGKLSNCLSSRRTQLADYISFVSTGAKSNPCYSLIDKGEGQTPQKMPDTFLSLTKSNKLRIPFVQGKFNMGGTGVFQFCGKHNLQLIISKRKPEISKFESDPTKDKWGFTIIRRDEPQHGVKSSVYRYLVKNKQIISFNAESLPLLPGDDSKTIINPLEYGTFIKLYEYQMTGLKTNILFDLYNRLSLLMPNIALPVRMYERRGYSGHSLETNLSGLSVRLEEDKYSNIEEGFIEHPSSAFTVKGQRMKSSIYVFKKDKDEKYKRDEGILFTINGQTHGVIPKSFFSRNSVGMSYLANSILIIVDCSDIDGRAREDLFMNSRDRLRSGELKSSIEKNLEELVKSHPGLRALKEKRKREAIENKIKDDKPLVDVIQKMVKRSPTLSKLFIKGVRITSPLNIEGNEQKIEFKGKKFPSYFKLVKEFSELNPKQTPLNRRFRIQFETDAENNFFDRDNEPGDFCLIINDEEYENYSINLWNGFGNLNVSLPDDIGENEIVMFEWEVSDIVKSEPFSGEFYINTIPEQKSSSKSSGKRKTDFDDDLHNKKLKNTTLDIPGVYEIFSNEWKEYGFNDDSAMRVLGNEDDGYEFFINMDNKYLLLEKKEAKSNLELLDNRYKYGLVLIGLAFIKDYQNNTNLENNNEQDDIFSKISDSTKIIAPFLLPMISELGDLSIE